MAEMVISYQKVNQAWLAGFSTALIKEMVLYSASSAMQELCDADCFSSARASARRCRCSWWFFKGWPCCENSASSPFAWPALAAFSAFPLSAITLGRGGNLQVTGI